MITVAELSLSFRLGSHPKMLMIYNRQRHVANICDHDHHIYYYQHTNETREAANILPQIKLLKYRFGSASMLSCRTSRIKRCHYLLIIFMYIFSTTKRRKHADKVGKGLRHFSMKVCEKVRNKGFTSYNEVADELVLEFAAGMHGSADSQVCI